MLRTFTALPDLPSIRQILNPDRGWLSVIVPIARTNLVTNPSGETNSTGWSDTGAVTGVTRTTAQQYHGAYSLTRTVTASSGNPGMYFTNSTLSLTSGTTYAVSCKFLCLVPNLTFQLGIYSTGGSAVTTYQFKSTGKWQWIWLYHSETSSTQRRFDVREITFPGGAGVAFYVDGAQVEAINAGETVSTYIDGDQQSLLPAGQFPPAYGWIGTRHGSTSYRSAQTRDGGQVKNLDLFKLYLTAIVGLGLADPSHIVAQQGYTDGAAYQTSIVPPREFTVSGRLNTHTNVELKQARAALTQALALDATAPRQPVALLYQEYDNLEPVGDAGKIVASYKQGLGGQWNNLVGEDVDVPFQMWFPFIAGSDQGTAITQSETITVTNISNLMYRDATGDWSKIADLAGADTVRDIAYNPRDGTYYLVGAFTSIGGTSANHIVQYNPATGAFTALGTGLSSSAFRVMVSPEGRIYVGGGFATANGVTVNNVTYWDGSTFVALGSGGTKGVDNTVRAMTLDASGNLYVAGDFTNAGGGAATRIAKLSTAGAWSALSTGLSSVGQALATGLDGTSIYVGGTFATAGGTTVNGIAKWTGSAFAALGSGVSVADVRDIAVSPSGDIYAGGGFTLASGLTVNYVARWNGSDWSSLGSGITTGTFASRLRFGSDGLLYVTGDIQAVNSITTADAFAAWNGTSWILPDIDMAGTPQAPGIATGKRGELMVFFGSGTASNASAAQLNTLTNGGTARTFATVFITGNASSTSRLHQIRSYTTGLILSFNLTIFASEEIRITTGPSVVSIVSNVRGDLSQYVLPGSAPELPLLPGANSVAVLITGGSVTATAIWPKRLADASDLTY